MFINTGLVSPQFHVVYDDHFSTTQSYETNSLPNNWLQLFQERSENILAHNPILRDAHTLGPEWDDSVPSLPLDPDLSPSEGMDFIDSLIPNPSSINPSSEGGICDTTITLPSEGGIHTTSVIPSSEGVAVDRSSSAVAPTLNRPGWNSDHKYNTQFRKSVVAATSIPEYVDFKLTPTHNAMAYVAEQIAVHSDTLGSPTEVNPFSFLAADSSDVLHWGQMTRDPDRQKFEEAMQDKIDGLFAHNTLDIVPTSSMPPDTKPLSAIWSFHKNAYHAG
jgi:hypothetical protein